MKKHQTVKPLILFSIALAIVTAIFFDVIFLNRSLQPSNINPQIGHPEAWAKHSIFPQLNRRTSPGYGYGDLGASAWQSEPARYVMARDFRNHESPFWNPYSAAGTVGPETLVDIKFSPWTIISAYFFNASAESFDYGLILIYSIGVFLILIILHQQLGLSLTASIAGAVIYLLNGFALPNLNSHMGQPYFFFPIILYSLLLFTEKQTIHRWIFVAITHALILSITFLPTLLLVLFGTHLLNIFFFIEKQSSIKKLIKYLSLISFASITGFMLAGFLWFPIIDSFFVTDMLTKFQDRSTQPTHGFENLLSIFTPKHFWQTCAQMLHANLYPEAHLENDETVIAYMGIFTTIIASYAIAKEILKTRKIVILSIFILIFSYARIFGLTGFIDSIPIISGIGIQYFGCLTAIALVILVAHGIQNIQTGKIIQTPAIIAILLLIFAFLKLYLRLGFVDLFPYNKYIKIVLFQILLGSFSIFLLKHAKSETNSVANILILLMILELFFYMNTVRPVRYDPIEKQPAFISFVKNHIGDARVANIGLSRTLYPEYGAMYGIKQIETQNPGQLPWYSNFYTTHFGSDSWLFLTLGLSAERGEVILPEKIVSEAALDIANVKYILVQDGARQYASFFQKKNYPLVFQKDHLLIFENLNPLTEAILVPSVIAAAQIPETPDFNPATAAITDDSVLIEQAQQLGIPILTSPDRKIKPLNSSVTVTSFHNTEVSLQTQSNQPAVLAVAEVWHPNWKATVDGQAVYVGRINEAFRGIALTAGKHHIRIYYESSALRLGIYIACITAALLLLLALTGFYNFQKRKSSR